MASSSRLNARHKAIDMSGTTVGRWKVLRRVRKKGSDGAVFECQCECGTRRVISGDTLRRGSSRSCGNCGSRKKLLCANGHDTSVLGRTPSSACRACLRDKRLRTLYGISLDEYTELWVFQDGKCAICGTTLQRPDEIGKPGFGECVRVEVDHDHAKHLKPREAIRGLLCGGRWKGCNRRLGRIDDPEWLRKASEYLNNPPAQAFIRSKEPEIQDHS